MGCAGSLAVVVGLALVWAPTQAPGPAADRRRLREGPFPTVADGKVIASTSRAGVVAVTRAGDRLADTVAYRDVVGVSGRQVTSLVFLDFNRLLSLGGQAGLGESTGFQRYMADLAKVRAFGARTTSNASTSTAEISVLTTP